MSDGTPLPNALSGVIVQRLIEIDEALLYLISGALSGMLLKEPLEQTGALTPETAKNTLSVMLETYFNESVNMTVIGSYLMYAVDDVPEGYLNCDGTAVSRTTYAELFAVIGTGFGAGNGTTTFNLPEWSFQSPMGMGLSQDGDLFLGVGGTYGEQNHALIEDEMPAHVHGVSDPGHAHRVPKQSATVNAAVNVATPAARTDNPATPHITTDVAFTGASITSTGGSDAHNTVHPVQGVKMLIYAGV